jgi:hypothetical protein
MSQNDERRVLSYTGARELTAQECQYVSGALVIHTAPCMIKVNPNGTCTWSGDCEPPPRCQG